MFKTDAEGAGSRGEGRGQGNFELSINSDFIHEGQLTLAKVCVMLDLKACPKRPQSVPRPCCPLPLLTFSGTNTG